MKGKMRQDLIPALKKIIDPETGIDIVSMGMIKNATVKDGIATVKMKPTSPFCPMVSYLVENIEKEVKKIKGVRSCEVKIVNK